MLNAVQGWMFSMWRMGASLHQTQNVLVPHRSGNGAGQIDSCCLAPPLPQGKTPCGMFGPLAEWMWEIQLDLESCPCTQFTGQCARDARFRAAAVRTDIKNNVGLRFCCWAWRCIAIVGQGLRAHDRASSLIINIKCHLIPSMCSVAERLDLI